MIARGPRPNAGTRAQYQKSLIAMVEEMRDSVLWWLGARYRAREDEIVAEDASPSRELDKELRDLIKQWGRNFGGLAEARARWLARRVNANATNQLRASMQNVGLTVMFRNSRRTNNILQAVVTGNISLIKSIPAQFLAQAHSITMQSVLAGRDMGFISKEIHELFGKSKRRAIVIARDQTNKATEAISRARAADIGITHGIWMHRSGSKVPRETHQAMDGKRFKLSEGLYDPEEGRNVLPAELINCHCSYDYDLSTIGAAEDVAMDSRHGVLSYIFPAATIKRWLCKIA